MDINVLLWSESAWLPILSFMTLIPFAALFAILTLDSAKYSRLIAGSSMLASCLLSMYLLWVFDSNNKGLQLVEHIQFFGLSYFVGVDGSNILFIPLTAILSLLTLFYLQTTDYARDSAVLASVLAYETILMGAFSALNALQFWLWCCLEACPVVFLTLYTGSGKQKGWAVKLLLQFWGGGLLMTLIGFLLLGSGLANSEEGITFDWLSLAQNEAPFLNETLIFILLVYGFAIRMPLFPFHAWLPLLAEQGSVASSMVFIVGLKLGVYALVRFVLPLLPGVSEEWSGLVVTMALVGIFYGALLALMQNNLRRILAFAVISQTGVLMLGVFSFEVSGVEGSILLSLSYGLAAAGLILSVGFLYEHTKTAYLLRLGGLFDRHFAIALLFLMSALSMMAMPGTPSYNAAHLVIEGVVEKNGWIIALCIGLGNFLLAAFLLWTFQRLFLTHSKRSIHVDHSPRKRVYERVTTLIISIILISTGFYSAPWQAIVDTATGTIGTFYNFHNSIYNEELIDKDLPAKPVIEAPIESEERLEPIVPETQMEGEQAPHE